MNFDETLASLGNKLARSKAELARLKGKEGANPLEIMMHGVNYSATENSILILQALRNELSEK